MTKTPLVRRLVANVCSLLRDRLGMTSLEYGLIGAFVTSVAVGGVVVVGNRIELALNEAATDARYVGTSRIMVSADLDGGTGGTGGGGGSGSGSFALELSDNDDAWLGTDGDDSVTGGGGNDNRY